MAYPGLAGGGFGSPRVLAQPSRPGAVACADLDRDGRADLVVTTQTESKLKTYLQDASGSFVLHSSVPTGAWPQAVKLSDLDGDQILDAVVANGNANTIGVYRGSAGGDLTLLNFYPMGGNPGSIAVGDFNGDGIPDVACAGLDRGTVVGTSVYARFGMGGASLGAESHIDYPSSPGSVVAGDWNGDGMDDLAVALGDAAIVYQGMNSGFLSQATSAPSHQQPRQVESRDTDGDGVADLICVGSTANGVSVAPGRPGGFGEGLDTAIPWHPSLDGLARGDIDGDGKQEVAVSAGGLAASSIHYQIFRFGPDGAPAFATEVVRTPTNVGLDFSVLLEDMNADGRADLLTLTPWPSTASIYLSLGSNGFGPPQEQETGGDIPLSFTAGFVDGSSPKDIVVGDRPTAFTGHPGWVTILSGLNNGALTRLEDGTPGADYPHDVTLADLDGDSHLDAVVNGQGGLFVYKGSGSEQFQTGTYQGYAGIRGVIAGDVDGDGKLDVVTRGDNNASYLSVFLGDGHGNLAAPVPIPTSPVNRVTMGDVDGDGTVDFVATHPERNSISIFYGKQGGLPGNEDEYFVDGGCDWPAILDADGDGRADIIYLSTVRGAVEVLRQRSEAVSVRKNQRSIPALSLVTSNPARGPVSLDLTLSEAGHARIGVFDLRGRVVRELWSGALPAGPRRFTWNAQGGNGERAAAGVYFVRAITDLGQASTKFVLMN